MGEADAGIVAAIGRTTQKQHETPKGFPHGVSCSLQRRAPAGRIVQDPPAYDLELTLRLVDKRPVGNYTTTIFVGPVRLVEVE